MSTDVRTSRSQTRAPLSHKNKAGIILAGVIGALDLIGPFAIPAPDAGEQGPPAGVLWTAAALGLITLIAAVYVWRTGDRIGSRVIAGARILSAISALPAFFVGDVPAGLVATAAAGVVLTIVAVGLVLARPADSAQPE